MELIKGQLQRVWKLPAVVNFSLGGMGTGFYLIGLLTIFPQGNAWFESALLSGVVKLLGPALVAIGFAALTTEAGRPLRGINLFRHLRRSWMSRETLAAAIFIPCAGLDWIFPNPILRAVAAFAAIALMLCQGFIMYRARGVTAWASPLLPLLFMTSGFTSGAGLALIAAGLFTLKTLISLSAVGLIAAGLNLVVWIAYISTPEQAFWKATAALRSRTSLALILGMGHLFPIFVFVLALTVWTISSINAPIAVLSGAALIIGAVAQKHGIILKAGYLRTITIQMPGPSSTLYAGR